MSKDIGDRFKRWYAEFNGPISIVEPCRMAYEKGATDERLELCKKISNCMTFEEILYLIRLELDDLEQSGEDK